jgi:hypothetical protein
MNTFFTLKARIILLSALICQIGLKAHATYHATSGKNLVWKTDTTRTKRADTSYAVKTDTSMAVKAGSTMVIKSDTMMVIHPDAALIKKTEAIIAAKPDPATTPKTDPATTPVSKDAGTSKNTIIAPPVDGIIEVRNTATAPPANGLIEVKDAAGVMRVIDPSANADSAALKKTEATLAKKADALGASTATDQKADSLKKSDASVAVKTDVAVPVKTDVSVAKTDPAVTASTDATSAKKADTTLNKKTDTTLAKKPDTTLVKKSDTTLVQKEDTTQQIIKAQNVFLEVGGAGIAISVNYDTRFNKLRNGWGYRVGLGFFSSGGNSVETVPFQINYLVGEHSIMMEFGAGTTFLNSKGTNVGNSKWEFDNVTGFVATASIGFRYQPEHKGINFRLAFVPILYDEGVIPAGAVSIGYTFK